MIGIEIKRTDGKTDWQLLRRILYVAIVVWAVSVRLLGIDPFGLAKLYVVAWLMDVICIVALWLFVWHIMWPNRRALNSSTV